MLKEQAEAPERAEIVVEPRSFNGSGSGTVTGPIWLRHGRSDQAWASFPEAGWTDFPVVILGWWMAALSTAPGGSATCAFMDGPYEFVASDAGDTLLRLRCLSHGNRTALVADFWTPAAAFHESVRSAALAALAKCDQRGWTGRDVEALRVALAAAGSDRFQT